MRAGEVGSGKFFNSGAILKTLNKTSIVITIFDIHERKLINSCYGNILETFWQSTWCQQTVKHKCIVGIILVYRNCWWTASPYRFKYSTSIVKFALLFQTVSRITLICFVVDETVVPIPISTVCMMSYPSNAYCTHWLFQLILILWILFLWQWTGSSRRLMRHLFEVPIQRKLIQVRRSSSAHSRP